MGTDHIGPSWDEEVGKELEGIGELEVRALGLSSKSGQTLPFLFWSSVSSLICRVSEPVRLQCALGPDMASFVNNPRAQAVSKREAMTTSHLPADLGARGGSPVLAHTMPRLRKCLSCPPGN